MLIHSIDGVTAANRVHSHQVMVVPPLDLLNVLKICPCLHFHPILKSSAPLNCFSFWRLKIFNKIYLFCKLYELISWHILDHTLLPFSFIEKVKVFLSL